MATQSLEIQFYNGRSKNAGYTYAGHGASTHNKDAVWSFVAPADRLKKLTVPFTWDAADQNDTAIPLYVGWMNDVDHKVTICIDQSIHRSEYIVCHPCVHTGSLKIKTFDFLKKFLKHTGHGRPTVVKM